MKIWGYEDMRTWRYEDMRIWGWNPPVAEEHFPAASIWGRCLLQRRWVITKIRHNITARLLLACRRNILYWIPQSYCAYREMKFRWKWTMYLLCCNPIRTELHDSGGEKTSVALLIHHSVVICSLEHWILMRGFSRNPYVFLDKNIFFF